MKKNSIFIAFLLVIISFSACNNNKPKDVTLKEFRDSINYSFGQWQGDEISRYYFSDDSTGVVSKAFLKELDEAYNQKDNDELYVLGTQVGSYFKHQIDNGHFGDSTLTVDMKMVMQGLINAINDYQEVITEEDADAIYQSLQEKAYSKHQ